MASYQPPRASRYPMLDMADAWEAVRAAVAAAAPRPALRVPLASPSAVGGVTAVAIAVAHPVPAVPCSRLDGYAVAAWADETDFNYDTWTPR